MYKLGEEAREKANKMSMESSVTCSSIGLMILKLVLFIPLFLLNVNLLI